MYRWLFSNSDCMCWYSLFPSLGFIWSGDFLGRIVPWSLVQNTLARTTLVKTFDHLEQFLKISSSDIDLYKICENECLEETLRCVESCISDDQCKSKCFREEIDCLESGFIFMYLIKDIMNHNSWFINYESETNESLFKIAVLADIIVLTAVKIVQTKYVRKCLFWVQAIRIIIHSLFALMARQITIWISNSVIRPLCIGLVQLLLMENSGFLVVQSVRFVTFGTQSLKLVQ